MIFGKQNLLSLRIQRFWLDVAICQVDIIINRLPPATNINGQAVVKNTPRNDRHLLNVVPKTTFFSIIIFLIKERRYK